MSKRNKAPVVLGDRDSANVRTIAIDEVLREYDVESIGETTFGDPFVVVSPRVKLADINMAELGTSSPSPFAVTSRREYNMELSGLRGLEIYDRMRRSDGAVRGTLRLVKTPVLAARWFVEPTKQKGQKKIRKMDQTMAEFVWECLTDEMSISWAQVLVEALLMCDYGYYMFEKVWENREVDGKTRTVLKKLAPRHPMDVKEWHYDSNGGPAAVTFFAPRGAGYTDEVTIPIEKLLVFTFDRECGNIEGISVLRSAYKHWYYKEQLYKIDAIQKERHGIGIPIIQLPVGFTKEDKSLANELGRNLRTNERAHVVLPPNWSLLFAKLEGNLVNSLESVAHHDSMIHQNVLAGFLDKGATTKEEDQQMFLKATRFIADIVCDTFNQYLIPDLIKYNFPTAKKLPKLRARRIGESADWRTISFAVRNLIGAKALVPDDPMEDWLRDEMDLPQADPETSREVATPQGPGESGEGVKQRGQKVGLPRQAKPGAKPPRGNAGTDRSGGK